MNAITKGSLLRRRRWRVMPILESFLASSYGYTTLHVVSPPSPLLEIRPSVGFQRRKMMRSFVYQWHRFQLELTHLILVPAVCRRISNSEFTESDVLQHGSETSNAAR